MHPVQDPVQHQKHILSKLFLTWGTAPWRLSSCRLQELLCARTPELLSAVCQLFLSSSAGHYTKDVNVNSVGDAWYFGVDPDPRILWIWILVLEAQKHVDPDPQHWLTLQKFALHPKHFTDPVHFVSYLQDKMEKESFNTILSYFLLNKAGFRIRIDLMRIRIRIKHFF